MAEQEVNRSSITGQFVSDEYAEKHPDVTVTETIRSDGLYGKFRVQRADGRDEPGQKHDGCRYYVLDVTHDPAALPALRAYADAVEDIRPQLAADLRQMVLDHSGN